MSAPDVTAILRRAAAKVRRLGDAAHTDGWTVDDTTVFEDDTGVCARCSFHEDAVWIALASPVLAEPLAAWLETAADYCAAGQYAPTALVHDHPLAIARALLADEEGSPT